MLLSELFEATQEVGICFGRWNPAHKGHKAAWEIAAKSPIWYVGTNKTTVGPKDPLPFDVKIEVMKTIWPEVASHIVAEQSWLTLCSRVFDEHGEVTLNIVTDEEYVIKLIDQYNGVEGKPHGYYKFNLNPTPSPRISSATDLRNAVAAGDRDAFARAAGVAADTNVAGTPFFDLVAKYLIPYADAAKKPVAKKAAKK